MGPRLLPAPDGSSPLASLAARCDPSVETLDSTSRNVIEEADTRTECTWHT